MTIAGMNPDPARQQRVEWVELAEVALAFATFADERAVRPTPCTDTLVRALRRHVVRPSKSGPALSFVQYAEGAQRGNGGVVVVTALVFDLDHLPAERAREVVRALRARRWAYLLYSSFSHRAGGPDDCCFRVVLPLNRPARPAEYASLWANVNAALGGHADPKTRDLARLWFTPSCPAERIAQAVYEVRGGFPVEIDAFAVASEPSRCRAVPHPPPPPVSARRDRAKLIAQYRLNHDPGVRERAALWLDARIAGGKASRIRCPLCGRPAVWFWLAPDHRRTATCNHKNSCGWWGFLDTLLDTCGGSDGQ